MTDNLQHACMICGKVESQITVYRLVFRELVKSDECMSCYEYLNARVRSPVIVPITCRVKRV